ncbi:MAG: carboxypeptidase regulatory-like domain-containing protein [Acidobacteriaceae bacterium]|nr:carboxypeptidase regulatory-like domain-containing protein [Acidobacteriaceae bacterium]
MKFVCISFMQLGFLAPARRLLRCIIWISATVLLLATSCLVPVRSFAQAENTGSIAGTVADTQGYVVTNATVTLTSAGENKIMTAKVNEHGQYLFPSVKADTYILRVSAPTFEDFVARQVDVNAGENVRVDAKLTLGSSNVSVTVEAQGTGMDVRSATVAAVIDPSLVQNLPVDGANVVALSALLPGVTNVNAPTTFTSDTGGPTYNVSGARSNQNLFLLDGALWNNVYYNTGLNQPPPFMLQEVSVQLNNFKAQYGRNVGSVFNALTRSGTSEIHGTVWDYINNRSMNAADYITQRNPQLVSNQYGATIGGPIIKNKLFYFLGFQALHADTEMDGKAQTPTLSERGLLAPGVPRPCISAQFAGMNCASFAEDFAGDPTLYSEFLANTVGVAIPTNPSSSQAATATSSINSTYAVAGGTGTSPCITEMSTLLASTATKKYFPNGEVPTICFNPVIANFAAKYLPLPNEPNGSGLPYTVTYAQAPRRDYQGLARFDWNVGQHTIDAHTYLTNPSDGVANGYTATNPISTYGPDANSSDIRAGNIGDTWILKQNVLNVARIAYKRFDYKIVPTDSTTLATLGGTFSAPGTPVLPNVDVTNRFAAGSTNSTYSSSTNTSFELGDNIIWTHGNHNFMFGGQFLDLNYIHRSDYADTVKLSTNYSTVGAADFLMGLISSLKVGNLMNISAVQHAAYFFAQDDWRATSRLTLNLGIRYELPLPWYQPNRQSVTFIPGYQSYQFPNSPAGLAYQGDPGIPNSITKKTFSGLAPRFGLAYDLFGNGKTSIRAGFGIFYDSLNANTVGIGEPYHYEAQYFTPSGSFSDPLLGEPAIPASYTNAASAQFATPYTVNFADANITLPYTEAINIGIQQHIAHATLEMMYIGKFGRHAIVPYDNNPAIYDCSGSYFQANPAIYCPTYPGTNASFAARAKYPGYATGGQGIVDNNTVGTSNYNGLQLIYTQRSRKSLSTMVSYTYSRSLDDQSNGSTNQAAVQFAPNVNTNYGPSDFQATHVVNMGWVYKVPSPAKNRWENAILSGWSFGGIFNARTGNPINIQLSGDQSGTNELPERPPLAAGLAHYVSLPSNRHRADKVQEWFNVASFNASPGPAYTGAISRNYLYGPAFIETDLNVKRQFPFHITKSSILEFRADVLNAWNTPNLGKPNTTLAISSTNALAANINAGEITKTVTKNPYSNSSGRRVQLVLVIRY